MFSLFYDCVLFLLGLIALPRLLWQRLTSGKYRESLSARLGFTLPSFSPKKGQKVIWIHTVSMGETRAVIPLYKRLKEAYPDTAIVISTTTETGHLEAKRSMADADAHFFLPLDFSWIIKRVMNRIKPNLLILVESDFWYHLLAKAKERGASVILVNGKISERSTRRFQKVSFFTKRLFKNFDLFAVQSKRYAERFEQIGINPAIITVTGNLKLDASPKKMNNEEKEQWKIKFGIQSSDRVLTIGSSHAPEEEMLLDALDKVWMGVPDLKVLLVPRHPERFSEVADILRRRGISFIPYSRIDEKKGEERVVLVDAMGLLNHCYQISEIAIVAGSFTDRVGGHNIFEPVLFDVPTLFGPHMRNQLDLVEIFLEAHAGKQVSIEELPSILLQWLNSASERRRYCRACHELTDQVQGSVQRTFDAIKPFKKNL